MTKTWTSSTWKRYSNFPHKNESQWSAWLQGIVEVFGRKTWPPLLSITQKFAFHLSGKKIHCHELLGVDPRPVSFALTTFIMSNSNLGQKFSIFFGNIFTSIVSRDARFNQSNFTTSNIVKGEVSHILRACWTTRQICSLLCFPPPSPFLLHMEELDHQDAWRYWWKWTLFCCVGTTSAWKCALIPYLCKPHDEQMLKYNEQKQAIDRKKIKLN